MKEKKLGVEDALHSTRAAVEEGVVGWRRSCTCKSPQQNRRLEGDNEDQNVGINIALEYGVSFKADN